jgi:hypothetical protein
MSAEYGSGERPSDFTRNGGPAREHPDSDPPPTQDADNPTFELAEALSELPEIARRYGRHSKQVTRFRKDHKHIPEFEEYADECLRLEFAVPTALGDHHRGEGKHNPSWIGHAFTAIIAASLVACTFGFYAVSRWTGDFSREYNFTQRERNSLFNRFEEAKRAADTATTLAEVGQRELREQVVNLTNQLASSTVRSDRLQDEINHLQASIGEKSRSLVQAQQTILRLEEDSRERDVLKNEIAKLRDREDRFYAQFRTADRMVKTTMATNLQSMIADAGLLRLVLRTGLSEKAIESVRKTTTSDLAEFRKILADIPRSISAGDPEVTARTVRDVEVFCKTIDGYISEFGSLDPLDPRIPDESTDEIVSAALLNYGLKKQLYALQMRRATALIRDDDLIQRVQSFTGQLEASARETRVNALSIAPPAALEYIKKRESATQSMISVLRSPTRDKGTTEEIFNRRDK